MYLLLDTETTGLDPSSCRVWEVGLVVVDHKWSIAGEFSMRMKDEQILEQLAAAADSLPNVPRLTDIEETAIDADIALKEMIRFIEQFDIKAVFAYNAKFDEGFIKAMLVDTLYSMTKGGHALLSLPWYCLMEGISTNYKHKCWKLGHLALDYGIAVDPALLHGALEDIKLTHKIALKAGLTPKEVISFSDEPWLILRAITEKPWHDGGASTAIAKELGFSWEKARGMDKPVDKAWVKRVKRSFVDAEFKKIGDRLPVRIIEEQL